MHFRPALLALLVGASAARAQELSDLRLAEDLTMRGMARLVQDDGRDTFVVGESFALVLTLEIERSFLEEKLVQLFQRRLDLPLQVQAPWLQELAGAELGPFEEPADGVRLALGEELVRARRLADGEREGRTFARFELARPCRATRVGALELAAPVLRFAYAETFSDDFLEGRVPRDRHDALVHGNARTLTILPPPEEGRPLDFSGAIGNFSFTARLAQSELAQGDTVTLELEVAGAGDLDDALAPRLEGLEGFHVVGELVEREPTRLVARHDLVTERAGTLTLPAQRYVTFDTTPPAGYRTLTSEALTLVVTPRAAPNAASAPEGTRSAAELPTSRTWRNWIVGGLALAGFSAWLVRRRARA